SWIIICILLIRLLLIHKIKINNILADCDFFSVTPSQEEIRQNTEIDRTILEYTRSEVAFAVLSMLLMVMGISFALYTFLEPRYMFKRLAGGVHFICGKPSY